MHDIQRTVNAQRPAILQVRKSKIPNTEIKFQYSCCSPGRQPDSNSTWNTAIPTFFMCFFSVSPWKW